VDPGFLVAINSMLDSGRVLSNSSAQKDHRFLEDFRNKQIAGGRIVSHSCERFIRQHHHGERCHCGLREGAAVNSLGSGGKIPYKGPKFITPLIK